ncbi:MAG: FG-GAP-like repeat-containing protein [Bacteroidota bacterium]|nr:FG-GAP-like repeat-containing protein [Bacteroidota bacterium]
MLHCPSSLLPWSLRIGLLLAPAGMALAQAPTITTVSPGANALAVPRAGALTISFSQPLTAASASALKVFSAQRGGLRSRGANPAVVSGSTLSFAPAAYPYLPGEKVQYTVTTAAASSGGALVQGRTGQFAAAVGGTGRGVFSGGSDPTVGADPFSVTVADLDGDGDLDLLTANFQSTPSAVNVQLNNGNGTFGGSQNVGVGRNPFQVVAGDVDGDGDLDLLTANFGASSVSVRLNNGSGLFSGSQEVSLNNPSANVALGDADGDGDLDLFASVPSSGVVSVRLNNGTGTFSGSQDVPVGTRPYGLALGDLDGDGDLDFLVTNNAINGSGTVNVRLNDGTGTFGGSQSVAVGINPVSAALGDVDGDGDLDFLAASFISAGTVSVRLNDGTGTFSGSQSVAVGNSPNSVALGDVDADGHLDLVTSNGGGNNASVCLNPNGTGIFGSSQSVNAGTYPHAVALGDLDADGDLDLLVANDGDGTVSIRLNGGTGPLAVAAGHPATALALFPNPAHDIITLTGAAPQVPIEVLDALGRVRLVTTAGADGTVSLALPTGLPAGIYLMRSGARVQRLLVE